MTIDDTLREEIYKAAKEWHDDKSKRAKFYIALSKVEQEGFENGKREARLSIQERIEKALALVFKEI